MLFTNDVIKPDEQSEACFSSAVAVHRRTKFNDVIKPDEQSEACFSSAVAVHRRTKSNDVATEHPSDIAVGWALRLLILQSYEIKPKQRLVCNENYGLTVTTTATTPTPSHA